MAPLLPPFCSLNATPSRVFSHKTLYSGYVCYRLLTFTYFLMFLFGWLVLVGLLEVRFRRMNVLFLPKIQPHSLVKEERSMLNKYAIVQ